MCPCEEGCYPCPCHRGASPGRAATAPAEDDLVHSPALLKPPTDSAVDMKPVTEPIPKVRPPGVPAYGEVAEDQVQKTQAIQIPSWRGREPLVGN